MADAPVELAQVKSPFVASTLLSTGVARLLLLTNGGGKWKRLLRRLATCDSVREAAEQFLKRLHADSTGGDGAWTTLSTRGTTRWQFGLLRALRAVGVLRYRKRAHWTRSCCRHYPQPCAGRQRDGDCCLGAAGADGARHPIDGDHMCKFPLRRRRHCDGTVLIEARRSDDWCHEFCCNTFMIPHRRAVDVQLCLGD